MTSGLVAVLDALEAVARAVAPDVPVHYGPIPADASELDPLSTWLAYDDTGETPAVAITASAAQEDGSQQLSIVVECAAAGYTGGMVVRDDLDVVTQHVDRLRDAVNADRTLGGVAINAEWGEVQNLFMGYDGGVRVLYLFSVRVTAWS